NRRAGELCGKPPEALIGMTVRGGLIDLLASAISPHETTLTTAAGKKIPVEVVCRPFKQGQPGAQVFALRDLNERKRAAEALRRKQEELDEREEQFREEHIRFVAALDHVRHGLCLYDADQRIVFCTIATAPCMASPPSRPNLALIWRPLLKRAL